MQGVTIFKFPFDSQTVEIFYSPKLKSSWTPLNFLLKIFAMPLLMRKSALTQWHRLKHPGHLNKSPVSSLKENPLDRWLVGGVSLCFLSIAKSLKLSRFNFRSFFPIFITVCGFFSNFFLPSFLWVSDLFLFSLFSFHNPYIVPRFLALCYFIFISPRLDFYNSKFSISGRFFEFKAFWLSLSLSVDSVGVKKPQQTMNKNEIVTHVKIHFIHDGARESNPGRWLSVPAS